MRTGDEICLNGSRCQFYGVVNFYDAEGFEVLLRKNGPYGRYLGAAFVSRQMTRNDLLSLAETRLERILALREVKK